MASRGRARKSELGGVFDWVKKTWKKVSPPAPGALIPRDPEQDRPRLPSIFDVFRPGEAPPPASTLPSMFEAFRPPAAPEPSDAPLIFAPFKPSPPAEPEASPAAPPKQDLALWEALFDPAAAAEAPVERPLSEMFAGPPPGAEPVEPPPQEDRVESRLIHRLPQPELRQYEAEDWHREYPDLAERTQGRMPLWVAYNMGWSVPSTMEVVNQLRESWDLPMIFDAALSAASDPYWRKEVQQSAHTGEPATLEIEEVGTIGDPYRDLMKYLGVPDHVIDFYAAQFNGLQLLSEEVLAPLLERVGKAMEILKPPSLKGWFLIGPSVDEDSYWLKYKEVLYPGPQEG